MTNCPLTCPFGVDGTGVTLGDIGEACDNEVGITGDGTILLPAPKGKCIKT